MSPRYMAMVVLPLRYMAMSSMKSMAYMAWLDMEDFLEGGAVVAVLSA